MPAKFRFNLVEMEGRVISTRHRPSKLMILPDFCPFLGVFAWFSIRFPTAYRCLISYPRHQTLQVKSIAVKTNLACFIFVSHPLLFRTFRATVTFILIIDKHKKSHCKYKN